MRVLITGGAGLLGSTLIEHAPMDAEVHATYRSIPVVAPRSAQVELSDADAVAALWAEVRPELVIHTAYSMESGERDVWQATRNVVRATSDVGAALIHMSTDALLDGEHGPYAEDAKPAPVHEYGRWKAQAERHVRAEMPGAAVVRTSLVTRLAPLDPRSAWIAGSLRDGRPLTLFVDELRCPIAGDDLARQLWEIASLPADERAGMWHLAGPEALSRYALGLLVAAHEGLDPAAITPALSAASPSPRPRDLRLLTARADRALRTRARPISELLLERRRR
ncbi:MAG: dTDP-4-dehydrorhamnose reductase [Gemmatimonadetes bacterium]|nr:dTDP-4-dehydrorhamnose reductase [Gemmatimonadota bacterium]